MSKQTPGKPPAARQIAYTMMLIWMVGLAFSIPLSIQQNYPLALAACGGSILVSLLVFFLGGFLVASGGDEPEE